MRNSRHLCAFVTGFLGTFCVSAQITLPLQSPGLDGSPIVNHDDHGNLYAAGRFSEPIDFDPGSADLILDPTNGASVFLASYNPQGVFRWAHMIQPGERTFTFREDNGDLAMYNDGWQTNDAPAEFSHWFVITESGWSGHHALNSDAPLEGLRSWQIAASNTFYGIGRALLTPVSDGRISVLIRHDLEPNGSFVGFNLHGTSQTTSFGGPNERISFGLFQTNQIGVTVDSFPMTPDFHLAPTQDGDLRGDLLEYMIDVRATSNWTIRIINHTEPGTPTVTTNVSLQSIHPTVRSIRFGSFIAGTNHVLAFDRIRVAPGLVDSVIDLTGISFVQPSNIWVHGGMDGSLYAADEHTNTQLLAIGGTNGFALGYDLSGRLIDSFQVTSTSAPGHSVVGGVARASTNNLHVYGHFSGDLTFRDNVITSGIHQLLWRALITTNNELINFRRYAGTGMHQSYGTRRFLGGTVVMLGSFSGTGILGLNSAGGQDIMIINAEAGVFQFGGPGDDFPCRDCVFLDEQTLFFGGNFQQTITFDRYDMELNTTGPASITASGQTDMFIAAGDGYYINWARPFGGGATNRLYAMTLDTHTNIIVAGAFRGAMEMDGVDGSHVISSKANGDGLDAFVASYDAQGGFRWAHRIGPNDPHEDTIVATSAAADASGRTVVAMEYTRSIQAEIGDDTLTATNAGNSDILLVQLENDGSLSGPVISMRLITPDEIEFAIASRAGIGLRLETSDLSSLWAVVTNIANTIDSTMIVTESTATSRVYRARATW